MANIVVIGSLNMDLVALVPRVPHAGETLLGIEHFAAYGGKGANQAYAAAKLGEDVVMLGRVGADDYGKQMCANLKSVGCDVTGVKAVDGSSGIAMIFVAESGQNCIVVVPGANHRYLPSDLILDDAQLTRARYVMLQLETPIETVVAAARRAKLHGAEVILDPAPALPDLPADLLRQVDLLTPNESEAAQLIGRPPAALSLDDAESIAREIQAMGAPTVIIKMGAQGCLLADGPQVNRIPAPQVKAVDTTAAGDVFNAAMTVARSEGASILNACEIAVRAAALSVTRFGAQLSTPSRQEFNAVSFQVTGPRGTRSGTRQA
jgi:ribokinase